MSAYDDTTDDLDSCCGKLLVYCVPLIGMYSEVTGYGPGTTSGDTPVMVSADTVDKVVLKSIYGLDAAVVPSNTYCEAEAG